MVNRITGLRILVMPLALLVAVLVSILYVQPLFSEVQKMRQEIADDKDNLSELDSQIKKISSIQSGLSSLEGKKYLDAALPASNNPEDYVAEIYQRAARSGVLFDSIVFAGSTSQSKQELCSFPGSTLSQGTAESPSDGVSSASGAASADISADASSCAADVNSTISLKGNWDQVLSFLKYLTDTSRVGILSKLDLSASSSSGSGEQVNSDILSAKIDIEIYSKKKNETTNPAVIDSLAKSAGFDQETLENLKKIVYAVYEAPHVDSDGERNIFK